METALNCIAITSLFIASACVIIYLQSKPKNDTKSRLPTKAQIDSLFDSIDPINQTLPQRLCDTENVH